MSKKSRKKYPTWANPEMNRAMQELRRSSAAQPHVPLPRKGTRKDRRNQAIRDHDRNQ